eukprot:2545196-Pleurochrysis_carterae.AAC.1
MEHVRHECRVRGLGYSECTGSEDPVCMNQRGHEVARRCGKLEFDNCVEHTADGVSSGTGQ